LRACGIAAGDQVRLRQGDAMVQLAVVADATVAAGCVRVASAHAATAGLGALSGQISMERV